MELRPLGETGLRVSVLGLGTVKLGRERGVKYPEPVVIPDDASAAGLLAAAEEAGVNLLDTAPAYGVSEERLGKLIAGRRERWVIVTKAGEEFEGGVSRYEFSAGHIRMSVERSLRRLRTDRVDVVLLHSDGRDEEIIERTGALEALADLRAAGKVGAIGISTKTVAGGLLAVGKKAQGLCDVVMVTLNARERADLAVVRAARVAGAGVLVKKSLSSGHASAEEAEASWRLALAEPGVSSIVVGTASAARLRANASAMGRIVTTLG